MGAHGPFGETPAGGDGARRRWATHRSRERPGDGDAPSSGAADVRQHPGTLKSSRSRELARHGPRHFCRRRWPAAALARHPRGSRRTLRRRAQRQPHSSSVSCAQAPPPRGAPTAQLSQHSRLTGSRAVRGIDCCCRSCWTAAPATAASSICALALHAPAVVMVVVVAVRVRPPLAGVAHCIIGRVSRSSIMIAVARVVVVAVGADAVAPAAVAPAAAAVYGTARLRAGCGASAGGGGCGTGKGVAAAGAAASRRGIVTSLGAAGTGMVSIAARWGSGTTAIHGVSSCISTTTSATNTSWRRHCGRRFDAASAAAAASGRLHQWRHTA